MVNFLHFIGDKSSSDQKLNLYDLATEKVYLGYAGFGKIFESQIEFTDVNVKIPIIDKKISNGYLRITKKDEKNKCIAEIRAIVDGKKIEPIVDENAVYEKKSKFLFPDWLEITINAGGRTVKLQIWRGGQATRLSMEGYYPAGISSFPASTADNTGENNDLSWYECQIGPDIEGKGSAVINNMGRPVRIIYAPAEIKLSNVLVGVNGQKPNKPLPAYKEIKLAPSQCINIYYEVETGGDFKLAWSVDK